MALVPGFVGFCGSRALPASAASLVARVVASVVRSGRGVAVGCASGADAFALSAGLAAGARLAVFAVGGPSGAGFWRSSAFGLVSRAAASGAAVSWWAGGSCCCPSCSGSGRCPSLVGRLRRRSLAFVGAVAASGPGAGLVAFVSSPSSRGSFLSVRAAVAAGLPVVVFPVGFPPSALPVLPGGGRWVPAASSGVWASGWRWQRACSPPDQEPGQAKTQASERVGLPAGGSSPDDGAPDVVPEQRWQRARSPSHDEPGEIKSQASKRVGLAEREERCPHCGSGQTLRAEPQGEAWANGECRFPGLTARLRPEGALPEGTGCTPRPLATADDCPECAVWREQLARDPDLANYYARNPYLWHHWDVVCPDCGTLWHATAGLPSDTRCPTCRSS